MFATLSLSLAHLLVEVVAVEVDCPAETSGRSTSGKKEESNMVVAADSYTSQVQCGLTE